MLPTLAGSGSRPAGGSAVTPRGAAGNAGEPGDPPPPPRPEAGATMTGSVIGGIGSSAAATPTPGRGVDDGWSDRFGCRRHQLRRKLHSRRNAGMAGRHLGVPPPPPPPPPGPGGWPTGHGHHGQPGEQSSCRRRRSSSSYWWSSSDWSSSSARRRRRTGRRRRGRRRPSVVVAVVGRRCRRVRRGRCRCRFRRCRCRSWPFVAVAVVAVGRLTAELPPQCRALPLRLPLPLLPLLGFPPLPGLRVFGVGLVVRLRRRAASLSRRDRTLAPRLEPLPTESLVCLSPASHWTRDRRGPRSAAHHPEQAGSHEAGGRGDAHTRTHVVIHPSRRQHPAVQRIRQFSHNHARTVCCGSESTRDRDTPIRQMIRTIVLGCTIAAFS